MSWVKQVGLTMWELMGHIEAIVNWLLEYTYHIVRHLVLACAGGLVAGAIYSIAAVCIVGLTFAWVMGGVSLVWLVLAVLGK